MSKENAIQGAILRFPRFVAGSYALLVLLFIAGSWSAIADILHRSTDTAASRDVLERLEGHRSSPRGGPSAADGMPAGSPLLEGPTVTVAGASLLQRVAGAVTQVGGNILSSQVELQTVQSKAGFVGVIVSCELDQPALQKLLYDLESGMPFLFIDRLVAQAPVATSTGQEGRLHILLAVSGQWQGTK
ncbi:MAG TPA: type II secretion system protein GspM [Pseudolabrys sp.]